MTEYIDPTCRESYLSIQHIQRYYFAAAQLRTGQKVLDIGCGNGYGTEILSKYGLEVIGADNDQEAIAEAMMRYKCLCFRRANALDLPFKGNMFDAVVSFETIEHIEEGHCFLEAIRNVLKANGIFICSTPNIAYTSHPIMHKKEYKPAEFYQLIQRFFTCRSIWPIFYQLR